MREKCKSCALKNFNEEKRSQFATEVHHDIQVSDSHGHLRTFFKVLSKVKKEKDYIGHFVKNS